MATGFVDLLPALAALTDPTRPVALGEAAALAGLSPSRAQRVVSAAVGESPKAMDRRTRLDLAALLLAGTDRKVVDIAMASGFATHEGFCRAFRARFDETPTVWRSQRRRAMSADQVSLALSTSRCVRLLGRPLQRKDTPVPYDIEVETLDAIPVIYRERTVDRDQLGEALGEILPDVFAYVMGEGLVPAGHPFVRHVALTPAFITIQAGIPLTETPPSPGPDTELTAGELPAGPAAVTIHHGAYDSLGDAHAALDRWIAASEHESAGGAWELYLTDPGEVPDPADWRTRICWPIT